MKRLIFLGIGMVASVAAMAQTGLVKEVERKMKSSPDTYPTNLEQLKPAFTDPETAQTAYPYFVAGKGGYDFFDQLEGYKAVGNKPVDDKVMGHALIDSYGYLKQAMLNDTVIDEKGKVKTKYSKDVLKLINSHYSDYDKAARYLWGAGDFNGAYEAWGIFLDAPTDPVFGANAPKALADTVMAELAYNQALAAWQAERYQDALNSFDRAIAGGYDKPQIYDYAIGVSSNLHDADLMAAYAEKAHKLFGATTSKYVGYVINAKIKHEQYDEARQMVEQYISEKPEDGQLYYVLGILYDSQNNFPKALENYELAVKYAPENPQALYQLGRQLCNKAYTLDEEVSEKFATDAMSYNKARKEVIDPLFMEAAPYLEKAYQIDPDNTRDALSLLRSIYYNVGDEANLQRIENELKY